MPAREVWERALPVDRRLDFADPQQSRAGRFVHIRSAPRGTADDDELEATARAGESDSRSGRAGLRARRVLIGPPLRSTAIAEERMGGCSRSPCSRPTRSPRSPTALKR